MKVIFCTIHNTGPCMHAAVWILCGVFTSVVVVMYICNNGNAHIMTTACLCVIYVCIVTH